MAMIMLVAVIVIMMMIVAVTFSFIKVWKSMEEHVSEKTTNGERNQVEDHALLHSRRPQEYHV